jgi:hypothetical protein
VRIGVAEARHRQITGVIPMELKFEQLTEPYMFTCRRCGAAWRRSYEIRRMDDHTGGERELFLLNGSPIPSPRLGVACPNCGGYRVVARPERAGPPPAPERPRLNQAHEVAHPPMVLRRETLTGGEGRVLLIMGTTRLVLRHGPGKLPDEISRRLQSVMPVDVAGTSGRYSAAHWAEWQAQLVWEHAGRWFQLIGPAGRELLTEAANGVMADLTRFGVSGQTAKPCHHR